MNDLDPNLRALLARNHSQLGPPPDTSARMLADFHARVGPSADPDLGPEPEPLSPAASGTASKGAELLHGLKIAGAVLGLSTIGVAGLWIAGQAMHQEAASSAPIVAVDPPATMDDPPTIVDDPPAHPVDPPAHPVDAPVHTNENLAPSASPASAHATPDAAPSNPRSAPASDPRSAPAPEINSARTLAAELKLISAARTAPPDRALELLAQHAREFPTGELSSEREALRAVSLCKLGRSDAAAKAQASFERLDPGPLLREKVRKACAPSPEN